MTYDVTNRKLVIVGGESDSGIKLSDTWVFGGIGWRLRTTSLAAAARYGHTLAYLPIARNTILFGGLRDDGVSNDTWLFGFSQTDETVDSCHAGAAEPDADGDGLRGCGSNGGSADPDCWGRCTPFCPPWTTATDETSQTSLAWPAACDVVYPGAPRCGDGVCNGALETKTLCPQDCPL
jgi:hypothetical protein